MWVQDAIKGIAEYLNNRVGKVYVGSGVTVTTTASINANLKGASVTLPAGTYLVDASSDFGGTPSGTRTMQVAVMVGSETSTRGYYRNTQATPTYSTYRAMIIVALEEDSTVYSCVGASVAGISCNTAVKAIRIA